MSTIFISVGQCGNQLASSVLDLWKANRASVASSSSNTQAAYLFDHYDHRCRFVQVDAESKVVGQLMRDHGDVLRADNVLSARSGRGNNWAYGYHTSGAGGGGGNDNSHLLEQSMEAVRRESERCDFLLHLNVMHSLSGGTGSGCTSRLVERLRDTYGWKKSLVAESVAPFSAGELPLQHYNAALCLAHIHEFVDCLVLFQNDDVFRAVERLSADQQPVNNQQRVATSGLSSRAGLLPHNHAKISMANASAASSQLLQAAASISVEAMNSHIATSLLDTVWPVDNVSLRTQSIGMEFAEMQRFLCSLPSAKIVEIYDVNNNNNATSRSTSTTVAAAAAASLSHPLLKPLLANMPKYKRDLNDPHYVSLNSLVIARGEHHLSTATVASSSSSSSLSSSSLVSKWIEQDHEAIRKHVNPVEWNPFTIDFWHARSALNRPPTGSKASSSTSASSSASSSSSLFGGKFKPSSLTIAINRNRCVDYLEDVLERASRQYEARAYLHWYEKYGVGASYFEHAFDTLRSVCDTYAHLTR